MPNMPNMTKATLSEERRVIPAVLVYLFSGDEVLLIHKSTDVHVGKWNGLGGKCEVGEAFHEAAIREVWEEAGIELRVEELHGIGFLQFPNFKPREDWHVFVFRGELTPKQREGFEAQGERLISEGRIEFIKKANWSALPMWEGDSVFIPKVIENEPFFGVFRYEEGRLKDRQIFNF